VTFVSALGRAGKERDALALEDFKAVGREWEDGGWLRVPTVKIICRMIRR